MARCRKSPVHPDSHHGDIIGREVQTLVNEYHSSGEHFIYFDASALPNGIYIAKLQAGDKIKAHKMLLMK